MGRAGVACSACTAWVLAYGLHSSACRPQVMRELGLSFQVMKPDIDEKAVRDPDPLELPVVIALAKAKVCGAVQGWARRVLVRPWADARSATGNAGASA